MARALTVLLLAVLLAATALASSAKRGRVRHRRQVTLPASKEAQQEDVFHVLGDVVTGADDVCYVAFKGIAYAKPPVGDLRFKNPVPHLSQRRGSQPKCAQVAIPSLKHVTNEDCLYLNVYVPLDAAEPLQRLPVMVYIHGGGFTYGSATEAENGPDFLVRHGVILVTINYRLGPFGFLNLDNDDIPGNMGLKDQQLALRWVQTYITYFGGDPSKVTIFGNSAGSASVHYHSIAPSSRGLFRAAIMQSGNALSGWAYQETHLTMAQRLSEQLGGAKSGDVREVARTVRNASAGDILDATLRMIAADPSLQLGNPAFCPSPERRAPDGEQAKFLPEDPESLERQLEHAVPTIAGMTGQEGYFALYYGGLKKQPATLAALAQNPALLLPPNVAPYPDTARLLGLRGDGGNYTVTVSPEQAAAFGARIKEEYSLAAPNNGEIIPLLGDLFTAAATHRLIQLRLQKQHSDAPLHLYHFLEDGDYNWGKVSFGITEEGATHTDELGYLMRITSPRDLQQTARGASSSSKALHLLTELWTDFAKHASLAHHGWPAAEGSALDAPYAAISDQLAVASGLGGERLRLWDAVFGELRGEAPGPDLGDKSAASDEAALS